MPGLAVICNFCTSAIAVMAARECISSRRRWSADGVAACRGSRNATCAAAAAARAQRWVHIHTAAPSMQTKHNGLASNTFLH